MKTVKATVRVRHPSLDDEGEDVVLRGVLDYEDLRNLRTDFYQREKLTVSTRKEIRNALETGGKLPDITLGMRGDEFQIDKEGNVLLLDPVFIIDGLQRVRTVEEFVAKHCTDEIVPPHPRLGAIIYFKTHVKWEREQFHRLNAFQNKVSPNVLLRNIKDDNLLLATLHGLSKATRESVLYERVSWNQSMNRGELLTATSLLSTTLTLHHHLGISIYRSLGSMEANASKLIEKVGMVAVRHNVSRFFDLIDECWGLRRVQARATIPYVKFTFLHVLARLLSDHVDFWRQPDEKRLEIPRELRRKIAKFSVHDPEVERLCGASGKAREALYFMLKTHINSGKRTKRLTARHGDVLLDMTGIGLETDESYETDESSGVA